MALTRTSFPAWPDERLALAEHLWKSGLKAKYCAERCGVSRNAFLGMVHRKQWKQDPELVKLERSKESPSEKQLRIASARTRRERLAQAKPKPSREVPITKIGKITLMELTFDTCRWPMSGDGAATFFCGRSRDKNAEGAVYCIEHRVLAIRPGNPPKLRAPAP